MVSPGRNSTVTQDGLNSLSAHVAVLDQDGCILAVNEAWRRFARENGGMDIEFVGRLDEHPATIARRGNPRMLLGKALSAQGRLHRLGESHGFGEVGAR